VLVVDDDALARRLIRSVLVDAGLAVVAETRDGAEAVSLCEKHKPDVVVMDVVLPGLDGISAMRRIRAGRPQQLVVMLTGGDEDELGLLALDAGATGFLNKESGIDALPRALEAAVRGEAAISRRLSMRVVEHMRTANPAPIIDRAQAGCLTTREWEVVRMLDEGSSTHEIAEALHVSRETVRSHVKHILRKLGVNSRAEALTLLRHQVGSLV
jgi:DNA-binding NarL/FixJ family response regulator